MYNLYIIYNKVILKNNNLKYHKNINKNKYNSFLVLSTLN